MLTTLERATLAARAADEKKAENIRILDLHGLCNFTDAFVICSASNRIQLGAIVDAILEAFRKAGIRGVTEDGVPGANWLVLDAGDVVVHIMSHESRSFYRLENLWGDAQDVPFEPLPAESI